MYLLDKIVELADNEKIDLVFWVSPYLLREDETKIFNAIEEYAKAKDVEIDREHVNLSGSYTENMEYIR